MSIDPSSDDLAKQVAAALLGNVNNRQQPRDIRHQERAAARAKLRQAVSNAPSSQCEQANPAVLVAAPVLSEGPGDVPTGLGAGDLTEVVPNKYETCIPLVSGGTPLGTPLFAAAQGSASTSRMQSGSLVSTVGGGSGNGILSQYVHGGSGRRYADVGQPQYPPILQQVGAGDSRCDTEEVQQLMRLVEDEKRRNRRLKGSIQILEREVSLFRSRRQIFVTVVGFKLFNASRLSKSRKDQAGRGRDKEAPAMVGDDEHVEFFIVVDKSVIPKYVVRHRFNDFKHLHRLLESGSFAIPRGSTRENVTRSSQCDGRSTPWQHYGAPAFCPAAPGGTDSERDGDVSDSGSDSSVNGSLAHGYRRPSGLRLSLACDMMPQLPSRDRRRPSAGVGGIFGKLSRRLAGKDRDDRDEGGKGDRGRASEEQALRAARRAVRLDRDAKYRSHLCAVTGIPDEDLEFIERRSKELEIYLRQILSIDLFSESDVVSAFFTPDHAWFRDAKVRDASDAPGPPRSASEGSLLGVSNHLIPPVALQTGRISPGGDYILSSANLAVLTGDAIPDVSPGHATLYTPIATPYVSQNLPSQQQAIAFAQQHSERSLPMGGSSTWSGPLLESPIMSQAHPPLRPDARVGKRVVGAVLGGKGGHRFDGISSHSLTTSGVHMDNESSARHASRPTASAPFTESPSGNQGELSPQIHCLGRASPSPVPGRTVSPFTSLFGVGGSDYVNPNVAAFATLVIVADDARRLPSMLGCDGIADKRAQRMRDIGQGQGAPPRARPATPADSPLDFLPPLVSQNGNFSLLLSALGFHSSPAYSSASVGATIGRPLHDPDVTKAHQKGDSATPFVGALASTTATRQSVSAYLRGPGSPSTDLPHPARVESSSTM